MEVDGNVMWVEAHDLTTIDKAMRTETTCSTVSSHSELGLSSDIPVSIEAHSSHVVLSMVRIEHRALAKST